MARKIKRLRQRIAETRAKVSAGIPASVKQPVKRTPILSRGNPAPKKAKVASVSSGNPAPKRAKVTSSNVPKVSKKTVTRPRPKPAVKVSKKAVTKPRPKPAPRKMAAPKKAAPKKVTPSQVKVSKKTVTANKTKKPKKNLQPLRDSKGNLTARGRLMKLSSFKKRDKAARGRG
jgi:hypothetical protein